MSDQSRRKLLKSIAAGSGAIVTGKSLPESWSRPVVDSVMLPAHAQTSCDETGWVNGDPSVGSETQLADTATRCECEALVRAQEPTATGATWGFLAGGSPGECYAEFGWVPPTSSSSSWETKGFN